MAIKLLLMQIACYVGQLGSKSAEYDRDLFCVAMCIKECVLAFGVSQAEVGSVSLSVSVQEHLCVS